MTNKKKLKKLKKAIKKIIEYPEKGNSRRTEEGYPEEIVYDEFAYKRIVDSYRIGLKNILKEMEELE